ncbi:exodeoxyribonuclease I [bacterium SCSIO 12696]|nr:exodeoxyribonuclease I [bacterium SCSIO 12696]
MPTTLYWHDYETTSADPARTRPSQFAGVRTDTELNVIGDPLMIYCKPSRDLLPAPGACLVTGITPQQAEEEGLPERGFIARIHEELSQPGTCGVGYNSIRFDDEVTRYTLYRNFFDPYEREWKNGNSRWDIIDMFRLARALRPEGIEWPDYEDGSPCFKLEELTKANGLNHESAHDALSDVYATIAMAKLLKEKQPKLYRYLFDHRTKQEVGKNIDLVNRRPFLHVSSRLPRENGYLGLMMPLAVNPNNKNEIICANLNGDIGPLLNMDADEIHQRLYTRNEDLPEGESRIPLKGIHLNRAPVVATAKLLDEASAQRHGIDLPHCRRNWKQLQGAQLAEKLIQVYSVPREWSDNNPETALYSGFLPNQDKGLLVEVRNSSPAELADGSIQFSDSRYQELLLRYRARNYPDTLSAEEQHLWEELRYAHLNEVESGYLTLDAYFEEIEKLLSRPDCTERDRQILEALQSWGDEIL